MRRIPLVFQNVVRKRYFEIFKIFISDTGLILDANNYKNDVIIDPKLKTFNSTGIVAIIESHSAWGEPDDLTNEEKRRIYDGLKISVKEENYRPYIEKIADNIKRNLEEDVVIR